MPAFSLNVTTRLAIFLGFLAAPAMAEWQFDPNGTEWGGWAIGSGSNGVSMVVDCGNGGYPAIMVEGYDPEAEEEIFVFSVDGNEEWLQAADCYQSSCILEFDDFDQVRAMLRQITSGVEIDISLYRRGPLSTVDLARADTSIAQMAQERLCEMP